MKQIIWLILMMAIIPSALAISGGENYIYQFDECKLLTANITAELEIDTGEYSVISDCNETQDNFWVCDCENGYNFNMSFEDNTINNYSIEFNYQYERLVIEEAPTTPTTSGGGGGGGRALDGLSEGSKTTTLNYADAFIFRSKGYRHTAVILKVTTETIKLRVQSAPQDFTLTEGATKKLDTDGNGLNDFSVTLNEITSKYGGEFTFTILDETKPIVIEEEPVTEETEEEITDGIEEEPVTTTITEPEPKKAFPVWIVLLTIFVVVALIVLYRTIKREKSKAEVKQNEIKN